MRLLSRLASPRFRRRARCAGRKLLVYLVCYSLVLPMWAVNTSAFAAYTDQTVARLPVDSDDSYSFAVGDVDGANGPDVLVANRGQSRLLLNDGSGGFSDVTATHLPSLGGPVLNVALGDLTGDGHLDAVLAVAGQNRLLVNDGSGHFVDETIIRLPVDADVSMDVALGDLDEDGDLDVVVANRGSQNRLLINTGGVLSDLTSGRLAVDADQTHAVVLGHLDGDTFPDLFFANYGQQNRLHLNNQLGSFLDSTAAGLPVHGADSGGVALLDAEGDGDNDLAVADGLGGVRLLLNDGSGGFAAAAAGQVPVLADYTLKVAAGDVDFDGSPDLILGNAGQDRVLLNDGSGGFSDATSSQLPADLQRTFDLALVDADRDLDLDLLAATPQGQNRFYDNAIEYPRVLIGIAPDYIEVSDPVTIAVDAFDEDGVDTVDVVVLPPGGGSVLPAGGGGVFTFVPTLVGVHTVQVTASDGDGNSGVTTARFLAQADDVSAPVVSVAIDPFSAVVLQGETVAFQVAATDDRGVVSRTLTVDGVPVPLDGAGNGTFATLTLGILPVVARASDAAGNLGTANATLEVLEDVLPPELTFTAIPDPVDIVEPIAVSATATDDVMVSSLGVTVTGPGGVPTNETVPLDGLGNGSFTPFIPGTYTFTATATDPVGHVTVATATVEAIGVPDTQPPTVLLTATPRTVLPTNPVTLQVTATDDVAVISTSLTVNGTPVVLDVDGNATYTPPVLGDYTAEARAVDPTGNETVESLVFRAVDGSGDTDFPVVAITAPPELDGLSGLVPFIGTAQDATLLNYVLEFASHDSGSFAEFARGDFDVVDDVLGSLDTSLLENGFYDVRLTATDINGRVSSTPLRQYIVEGENKPGVFTMDFMDMQLSVSGISITVMRGYDSRRRGTSGDFGHGWDLEVVKQGVYENNVETGAGWATHYTGGFVNLPCGSASESLDHITEVRFSDTEFYRFVPTVDLTGAFLGGGYCEGYVGFTQVGGVPGASLTPIGDNYVVCGQGDCVDLNFNVYEPDVVRLTTLDGREFDVHMQNGVTRIADTNGNVLSISSSGVTHSSGQSISIARDGQGRITAITDPLGNAVSYAYDGAGDLVSVTDRNGNTATLAYDGGHLLTELTDPEGNPPVRNEYDEHGRWVARVDAAGNRMEIDTDVAASSTAVIDRLGNVSVFGYDDQGRVTSAESTVGTREYTYDADGNRLTDTDELGNTTSFTYNADGLRTSMTDPLGNVRSWTYNALGKPLTETDPNGNVTTRTYDGAGNLLTVVDALGNTTTFTYDASGNMATEVDALGNTTAFAYDAFGNMTTKTDALGNVTAYTYDANGNRLTEVDALGRTTTFTYDGEGLVLTETNALGGVTTNTYTGNGQLASMTDANGNTTSHDYDGAGNLLRTDHPDGTFELFLVDQEDRRTAHTDQSLRTRFFEYDGQDRLLKIIYPDGGQLVNTYDAAGRRVATTNPRGNATTFEYDTAGRQTRSADALGNEVAHTYDANGNRVSVTDPLGHVTTFAYDALNRLVTTTRADGTTMGVAYDALGRKASETDPAGTTTTYEYDALGRLTKVIDALGGETRYTYDAVGNRLSQTDANGNTTTYAYDALNHRVTTTLPLGMAKTEVYDPVGNRVSMTDFNGVGTTYAYDVMDRLVTRTRPGPVVETFTYTPVGKVATELDSRGTTAYAYDPLDRLLSRTDPDGTVISYLYDLAGNRTAVTTPVGVTTTAYDALNRPQTVTAPGGGVTGTTYDAMGNRATLTLPNGNVTTYAYDSLNRLTLAETRMADASLLASYAYTLAPAGNRTGLVEAHSGRSVAYAYDALYRLTSENIDSGARTIAYTYDAVGNRLTKNDSSDGLTTYTYDANDRLLTEGATTYAYDANGNTASRTEGGVTTTYTYDALDRLVSVADGTDTVAYTYDTAGIRVRAVKNGLDTTNYLVDKNRPHAQVLREIDGLGNERVSYVYGDDLLSQQRGGVNSYYGYDGQMSARQLTDAAGAVTDTYDFDGFGVLLGSSGSTVNDYLYAGEFLDPNTGFYYLRARWMVPELGRFLSADSFEGLSFDPATLHRYTYALNNPVNRIDPGGQFSMASMMVSVSIVQILVTMAPTIFTGIATVALIKAFWEPGFEMRYAGLDIIMADHMMMFTDVAMALYNTGNKLIEIGAALIDFTNSLIKAGFAATGLAGGLNSLIGSANAIAGLANLALFIAGLEGMISSINDIDSSLGSLESMMTGKKAPPPAATDESKALKDSSKEVVKFVFQVLSHVQ